MERLSAVNSGNPVDKRRGQLLSYFISATWVVALIVLLVFVVWIILTPSITNMRYLIGSAIVVCLFPGLWWLNRIGLTRWSGLLCMFLITLLFVVLVPLEIFEQNFYVFAIPTVAASFLLFPFSSYIFAALAILGYTIKYFTGGVGIEYNFPILPVLTLLATIAWIVANHLDIALDKAYRAEDRYLALVKQTAAVVYLDAIDEYSSSIYMSPHISDLLGYQPEDWNTYKDLWPRLLHPDDYDRVMAEHHLTNETLEPFNMDYRMVTRDGKTIWVHDEAVVERDAAGHPKFWRGIMYDITERRRAEDRRSKLYECFLNFGSDPIENINRLVALCGELLSADSALYNRLDHGLLCSWGRWNTPENYQTEDDPEGHICYDVIRNKLNGFVVIRNLPDTPYAVTDPNIRDYDLKTYIGRAINLGDTNSGSLCVLYKRDYEPSKDDESVLGLIASAISVEERRFQAEEGLRLSEERYRQAIENSPSPIYSVDYQGKIISFNQAFQNVFGYKQEALGKQYKDLIKFNEGDTDYDHLVNQVFNHVKALDKIDVIYRCNDGSLKHMLTRLYPLVDPDGKVIECVFANTDITERTQVEKVQAATYKISEAAHSTGNLDELYLSIHNILSELMPAENLYIALHDPDSDRINFPYFVDEYDETPDPVKAGRGLTEYVLRTQQSLLASPEVFEHLQSLGEVDSVGTPSVDWLGVPLKVGDRTIGVLVIQSYTEGVRFSETESEILKFVSTQVAIAIDRKRAQETLERRAQELSLLYQTSLEINAQLDLPTLLHAIIQRAAELLEVPLGGIYLMNPDGKSLQLVVSYNLPDDYMGITLQLGEGLSGKVAQTGEPIMVEDYKIWEGRASIYEHSPFRRVLGVPLKIGNQVIGVINITDNERTGQFTKDEVRLVTLLADQAAIAIENARLYEAAQRELADRKKTEAALHTSEMRYRNLFEDSPISLWEADVSQIKEVLDDLFKQGVTDLPSHLQSHPRIIGSLVSKAKILDVNRTTLKMFQAKSKEELIANLERLLTPDAYNYFLSTLSEVFQGRTEYEGEITVNDLAGKPLDLFLRWSASPGYEKTLANIVISLIDITASRQKEREMQVVASVSTALRTAQSRTEMLPVILDQLLVLLRADSAAITRIDPINNETVVELSRGKWEKANGLRIPQGQHLTVGILEGGSPRSNRKNGKGSRSSQGNRNESDITMAIEPLVAQGHNIGSLCVGRRSPYIEAEIHLLTTIADIAANAIYRVTLHEQTQQYAEQMAEVSAVGRALAETLDLPEIYARLSHAIENLLPDTGIINISIFDPTLELITCVYAMSNGEVIDVETLTPLPLDLSGFSPQSEVIRNRNWSIINDLQSRMEQSPTNRPVGSEPPKSALSVPMLAKGDVLGVLQVQSRVANRYGQADAELLSLLANTASIAIENARLFAETELRLRRLAALRAMDMAISSSFDLRVTLNVLLDQVTAQLDVDAASVLLFNKYTQTLEYAAGRGFRGNSISQTRLRLGEELAGKAAFERRLISVSGSPDSKFIHTRLAGEDFVAYYGMPLVAKGELKGVLEIFNRTSLTPDMEWLDFLETLSGDTAIAIDSTALFTDLQRTNIDLMLAYDSTLEGWSRVLEVRNQEPAGHTQRVVELTLELAEAYGLSEADLVTIRRGALLHDIGILGVPDSIVFKPGPLTPEEWEIMRRHPTYAYQILSPVTYLRPALDIPFCHHEKWDGNGYPRGLHGEQIPLSARIFAVVDVWDALRSNRPYRLAWSDEESLNYIRSQSGQHFDPQVVNVFLSIIISQEDEPEAIK